MLNTNKSSFNIQLILMLGIKLLIAERKGDQKHRLVHQVQEMTVHIYSKQFSLQFYTIFKIKISNNNMMSHMMKKLLIKL